MNKRTRNTLLAYGFDTVMIAKIDSFHHTVDALRSLPKQALHTHYTEEEVKLICDRIKRQAIPSDTLDRVIEKSGEACCFCADGNSLRPFQIHHAEEYAHTQNNSEDNLILICPTHHQNIPKQLSANDQKAVRRNWHAVIEIARAYRAKGLDFPFGLFVSRDYGLEPHPEELIHNYRLSNATALATSHHDLAQQGIALLRKSWWLPIFGASGDGKTTLSRGIAGHLWKEGYRVYEYQPPSAGRPLPLNDVLTFIQAADRPCVLILDDANRMFSETDLTQIGGSTREHFLVLATWTRDSITDTSKAERHFPVSLFVNWKQLLPAIKKFLMDHEPIIVTAIQRHQDPKGPRRVGLGVLDVPLVNQIERYEEVKTISEFLFLLRGGDYAVHSEIESLADDSRSDIPVVFAAIEQIAGFEATVSPTETASAIQEIIQERGLPAPTPVWVQKVFRTQQQRGRMQEVRGAFKPVHRDWSGRLIGAGLASKRTREDTERLLAPNIKLSLADPMRLMRLWGWLWYDKHAGPFMRKWLFQQGIPEWSALIGKTAATGLAEVGIVAYRMHMLFKHQGWLETVKAAFSQHEELLAISIQSAGPEDWFSLKGLAFTLEHACPELAARIVEQWDPCNAARLIESTPADQYHTVCWVFSSYVKHSTTWVEQVGRCIRLEAIYDRLREVRKGDIDSVFQCEHLLEGLRIPLRRSMIKQLTGAMAVVVNNAHLQDLHVGISTHPLWWMMFPGDMELVLQQLSPGRIANDLKSSHPRDWRTLADLSGFAYGFGDSFFAEMIDLLDPAVFSKNVETQVIGYENELRCLLWVLTRGHQKRRQLFASELSDVVLDACQRSKTERKDLILAFRKLDSDLAEVLLESLGIEVASLGLNQDLENAPQDNVFQELRSCISMLEATGKDYIIDLKNWQAIELEPGEPG